MTERLTPESEPEIDEPQSVHGERDRSEAAAPRTETRRHGTDRPNDGRDVIELSPTPTKEESSTAAKPDDHGKPIEGDENPPKPPPKSVFVVAGLIICALVAWGGYTHWRSYESSKQTANDTVTRPVELRTTEAKRLDKPIELTLPGETQALDTANIYPRATGYIDQRAVDIGSRVKKGDMLVHISAPDLDQQLAQAEAQIGQTRASLVQAKAQVAQAEATVNLAQVNLARANTLTQQGYETQQNRDQRQADTQTQQANVDSAKAGVAVAEANIRAQQAAIDRLTALTAFETVKAPFDGVVTSRNVDVGELVNQDSSTGTPMFTVVRDAIMRVIVRVPQGVSDGIRDGLDAKVVVPQSPQQEFKGHVTRSSVALLYSSRTLTTEVDVPNETGALRAGLYVTVTFSVPRANLEVNVPAEALMFDQHGVRIAIVENDIVKLVAVDIARDNGTTLDLRNGLKGGERVVLNPPATLKDGAKVKEIREEDEKKQDEEDKAKTAAGNDKQAASSNKNGGT
ncbi:efflux RND transporter periplasmic adaptor subunit [Lichenifustis flavocetrariae]|uniref:Efflux RND transporter periplasmic adaptor subunit n=1 Tax=Lichenifustis flavocetrariae TaxID=2949735 RepID=A0AA41YXC0_9HYPH|nr:efflux RND transporter periplasmic adaptor subunit [Lichenifustis flavocetrariae]MCW6508966.1 efflux RND transporter periplasmic adaptor subunit [Lichenifustis flavocetrariae]